MLEPPKFIVSTSLHSNDAGDPAILGTSTTAEGSSSNPASAVSSTPFGAFVAVVFIASASSSGTMFTTNSPRASMFDSVSFSSRSGAFEKLIATIGGSDDTILKNENGEAFTVPAASRETTHAIGRGRITDASSL